MASDPTTEGRCNKSRKGGAPASVWAHVQWKNSETCLSISSFLDFARGKMCAACQWCTVCVQLASTCICSQGVHPRIGSAVSMTPSCCLVFHQQAQTPRFLQQPEKNLPQVHWPLSFLFLFLLFLLIYVCAGALWPLPTFRSHTGVGPALATLGYFFSFPIKAFKKQTHLYSHILLLCWEL